MSKWERRGDTYYRRSGDWEYRIVRTEYGWEQFERPYNDDGWTPIGTAATLDECMGMQ